MCKWPRGEVLVWSRAGRAPGGPAACPVTALLRGQWGCVAQGIGTSGFPGRESRVSGQKMKAQGQREQGLRTPNLNVDIGVDTDLQRLCLVVCPYSCMNQERRAVITNKPTFVEPNTMNQHTLIVQHLAGAAAGSPPAPLTSESGTGIQALPLQGLAIRSPSLLERRGHRGSMWALYSQALKGPTTLSLTSPGQDISCGPSRCSKG